ADPATVTASSLTVRDASGTLVAGSAAYDSATNALVWTPDSPLASATTFTATVSASVHAADGGTLPGPMSWSFTSIGRPCSWFSNSLVPPSMATGSYELGVRFTVDAPAYVSALKYYRAPGEPGSHVGSLWTDAGVRLAQVAFSGESGSGWQVQQLPNAVA